eukprot:jgi/Orpsp1_1/1188137/evm.model.d7180000062759.1
MGRHSSRDRSREKSRHRKHSSHHSSRYRDYSESRERYRDDDRSRERYRDDDRSRERYRDDDRSRERYRDDDRSRERYRDDDRSRERYRDDERREKRHHRHYHKSSQEKSYRDDDVESDKMSGIITQSEISNEAVSKTETIPEKQQEKQPEKQPEITEEKEKEKEKEKDEINNTTNNADTKDSTTITTSDKTITNSEVKEKQEKQDIVQPTKESSISFSIIKPTLANDVKKTDEPSKKMEEPKVETTNTTKHVLEPKNNEKEPVNDILRQRRERMELWKKKKLEQQNAKANEQKSSIKEDNTTQKDTPKSSLSFNLKSTTATTTTTSTITTKTATTTTNKIGFKSKIKLNPMKKSNSFVLKSKINLKRPNVLKQFSLMDDDKEQVEEQPKIKKIKLLDDSDDEDSSKAASNDTSSAMDIDNPNNNNNNNTKEEEEIDALDAYMKDVRKEVEEIKKQDELSMKQNDGKSDLPVDVDQDDNDYSTEEEDEEDILALAAKKLAKRKDLIAVDHSTIQYEPFRKNFYIEPPELANMKPAEVEQVRRELDNIKVQGARCPKPVRKWTQFGLPTGCLEVIKKVLKYQNPSPIQCQAIPAVMSGRDVISVAKTGSGKTIAFLLPMFRAIKDQRPLEPQEGPIALIMTPTRELAVQIYKECRHFTRVLGLNVTCAYGGSPIKDQIAELKKGAEIIVCTPGRMIDLLCANSGRVTNLRRVTYLVLDEADRMFDMGFEPQVMKIVNNIRPDRQTLLFSATFPRQIDALARKILTKPLEITVGGKSVVCEDVEQHVEVREEETKFRRLLEILGLYYKQDLNPRTLVFVDRQEAADNLLRELIRFGYPCQSLHGGKDQADRDSTIADFKSGVTNILIATSVAARGLDVKDLNLVINYECPNHLEDYVHRVGRTGRAGNKGTAYTFVTPQQDKYANDIVNALKMSHTEIPPELQKLADEFITKVKAGDAHYSSSGFGGKGLERLDKEREASKKIQRKIHGAELDDEDDDNTDEEEEKLKESIDAKITNVSSSNNNNNNNANVTATPAQTENKIPGTGIEAEKIKAVQEIAALVNAKISVKAKKSMDGVTPEVITDPSTVKPATEANNNENSSLYAFEIEINDYPQKARWKVTNK